MYLITADFLVQFLQYLVQFLPNFIYMSCEELQRRLLHFFMTVWTVHQPGRCYIYLARTGWCAFQAGHSQQDVECQSLYKGLYLSKYTNS